MKYIFRDLIVATIYEFHRTECEALSSQAPDAVEILLHELERGKPLVDCLNKYLGYIGALEDLDALEYEAWYVLHGMVYEVAEAAGISLTLLKEPEPGVVQ